jgi:CRISPR-associated protein Cmr4
MKGTFAWATCPSLLKRHKRDLKSFGRPEIPDEPILTDDTKYLCGKGHISQIPPQVNEFILEDMKLNYNSEPNADLWAEYLAKIFEADWQIEFKKRFIIVSDSVFDFLAEVGTEVRARICIDDDTGTARKGALWYEESLPAETVLAGMVWQDPGLSKEQDLIANLLPNSKELRFGGKGSTGLGRVRIVKGA